MVMETLFGVTYLYWKESNVRGIGSPTGATLLAANLAQNSDCDRHHCWYLAPSPIR